MASDLAENKEVTQADTYVAVWRELSKVTRL